MFKFKGIASNDMQVVIEEEEHFIARASQRYEITEIEGRDGAIFNKLGYSVVERPIYVQCLNISKIDDILAWLNGEGEFEYKGRKTTARFYSQLEPQRSSCIRIIDTTFIRDPFWYKADEDYQIVKDRKDKKASGEYIHVEDSSNCRSIIGIGGNHEQETRSGKNYLNTLAKYKAGDTVTIEGITYTFNDDGSITCNGTASANSILDISAGIQTISGTNKKIVGLLTGSQVPANVKLTAFTSDWGKNPVITFSEVNKSLVSKMIENAEYTIFRLMIYSGTTVNNQTVYYQILDTSETDLTYEQHGVSPSPDCISSIVAVGSNVNLANKDNITNLYFNQNQISVGSTSKTMIENCLPNTTYTISKIKSTKFRVCTTNKTPQTNESIIDYIYNDNGDKITITTSDKAKYMCIYFYDSGTDTLEEQGILDSIKIEKGKVATPWSPCGQGCVKVTKCNKNLAIKNVKGYFSISDFKIKIDNNSESFLFYAEKGKEYTRSCKVNLDRNRIGKIDTLDVTQEMTVSNGQEINSKKFICDDSGIYIWFVNSTLNDSIKESFQIEESSTESTFVQHEEQSYIIPVQQEMLEGDTFDYDNEEEVHIWKKLILTGNEVFTKGYDKERVSGFYTSIDELKNIDKKRNDTLSDFLCNCLIEKKFYTNNISDEVWGNVNTFAFSTANQHILALNIENISTVDELKTYLKSQYDVGTPVMIYYKLQTPTRLAFTDEQKAVAKELNNVTNITTDSKAILDLDYFTITNEKIKNEGNIQSRPILRLEKTVSEAVEITINNVRFKYNFNDDKYVEIDCENKTVEYEDLNRNRNIAIGYDFPKLNIGNNEIIMNDGDCIIKVIRKDRWL